MNEQKGLGEVEDCQDDAGAVPLPGPQLDGSNGTNTHSVRIIKEGHCLYHKKHENI